MEKAETLSTITDCHYAFLTNFKPLLPGIACPHILYEDSALDLRDFEKEEAKHQ